MQLEPGEITWDDDTIDGYPRFFVGKADGDIFTTFERDHAEAIAAVERRKAEAA